jgi:signal transduction histidine kinase
MSTQPVSRRVEVRDERSGDDTVTGSHAALDPVRVLIVDDKPANLDALEAILQVTGYDIDRAGSGTEALKALLRENYACCLLDIRMPDMDGFETAELIRNDIHLRNLPVIFVTAEADDQREVFRGYEAGAVDFLIKPLEPAIVRSKVKIFGELYQQKQRIARSEAIENLNRKLSDTNDSLNVANRDLEHFTHIAAHDLREPLRKLKNIVDLLRLEMEDACSSEADRFLSMIEFSAEQALGMVDDFRVLTKITGVDLQREDVDMRDLVEQCVQAHSERVAALDLRVSLDPNLGRETVYPSLVRILYDNLIRNVLDHVEGEGFALEFTVEQPSKPGLGRVFGVRNTGSTIVEGDLEQVFKMFRKAGSGSGEGSGIGLSICKRVVDRHNGRIFAESDADSVHMKFSFGEGHE